MSSENSVKVYPVKITIYEKVKHADQLYMVIIVGAIIISSKQKEAEVRIRLSSEEMSQLEGQGFTEEDIEKIVIG